MESSSPMSRRSHGPDARVTVEMFDAHCDTGLRPACRAKLRKLSAPNIRVHPRPSVAKTFCGMTTILPILAATDADVAAAVLFYLFARMAGGVGGAAWSCRGTSSARPSCLLFTLLGVAGLYFLLDAEFLAAVQLVVYAGGTLILIIFGVMLTSKSPFSRFEPKLAEVIVAVSIAAVLLVGAGDGDPAARCRVSAPPTQPTGERYPVDLLGQALLGDYLVPFELASVLLLVVMIGAAYLAKGRRREGETGRRVGVVAAGEAVVVGHVA